MTGKCETCGCWDRDGEEDDESRRCRGALPERLPGGRSAVWPWSLPTDWCKAWEDTGTQESQDLQCNACGWLAAETHEPVGASCPARSAGCHGKLVAS